MSKEEVAKLREFTEEIQKEPDTGVSSRNILSPSKVLKSSVPDEDKDEDEDVDEDEDEDEDAKWMARLEKLMIEEEEAMNNLGQDEDVETINSSDVNEDDENEEGDDENEEDYDENEEGDFEDEDEDEEEVDEDEYVIDSDGEFIFEKKEGVPFPIEDPELSVQEILEQNAKRMLQYTYAHFSVPYSEIEISCEDNDERSSRLAFESYMLAEREKFISEEYFIELRKYIEETQTEAEMGSLENIFEQPSQNPPPPPESKTFLQEPHLSNSQNSSESQVSATHVEVSATHVEVSATHDEVSAPHDEVSSD